MKTPPTPDIVLNLDEDPNNADWIKTLSWDLPQDVDEFLDWLASGRGPGTLQSQVEHFMTLPAAVPMPEAIRSGLIDRGLLQPTTASPQNDRDEAPAEPTWDRLLQSLCECHIFTGTFGLTDEYVATLDFNTHANYCPAFKAEQLHDEIREEFARA